MGNKLKHEIKALTYHEVGVKMDDLLEGAKADLTRFDGAKQALIQGKQKVEELTLHVDKDMREELMSPEQASLVKRYLIRAVSVLQNLGIQSEIQYYQTQGRVAAMEKAVGITKGFYDAEKARFEAADAAEKEVLLGGVEEEDSRRPSAREVGTHPGNAIADRKEESKQAVEETPVEIVSEPTDEPVKRIRKKR
jgi:hypothetical protein